MSHSASQPRFLAGLAVIVATAAMLLVPAQLATAKAEPECAAGGVKVNAGASPAKVSVTDTTTSSAVQVIVSITGTTFALTPVDNAVTLTSATWCMKASTKTQNGTSTTGASAITNGKGVAQKIGYIALYSVTTFSDPVNTCWDGVAFNGNEQVDLFYTGPINTIANSWAQSSFDGSCDRADRFSFTIVRAPDQPSAAAICTTLGFIRSNLIDLVYLRWPAAPHDYWYCA